jgi:hypothetical protein
VQYCWDRETKVTQRVGALFVEQNIQDRGALAGATNRFLENELAESRARLEAQERRLEDFRQRHGQELPTQMESNLQALSSVQTQAQGLVESIARDDRKLVLGGCAGGAAERPVRPSAHSAGRVGTQTPIAPRCNSNWPTREPI